MSKRFSKLMAILLGSLTATPAALAQAPEIHLLDGQGRPLATLPVGDSLFVSAAGLAAGASYRVRLFDASGLPVSYFQMTADPNGILEAQALWYHTGVIGCSDLPGLADAPATPGAGPRFTSFQEARQTLGGQTFSVALFDDREHELARVALPLDGTTAQPRVYFSDAGGCLRNGYVLGTKAAIAAYLTVENIPDPGSARQLAIFLVANRSGWGTGEALAEVRPDRAGAAQLVDLPAGTSRVTVPVWGAEQMRPGAYDAVVRLRSAKEARMPAEPTAEPGDWITYPLDSGTVMQRLYSSPCPSATDFDIAGRPTRVEGFPHFELQDVFELGEAMWGAVDPLFVPANHPGGLYAAFYVVRDGTAGSGLVDVTEGIEIVPVKSGSLTSSLTRIWNSADAEGAYDVVVDFGARPAADPASWQADNTFNAGVDFMDKQAGPGSWVVKDPALPGPFPVLQASYEPSSDPNDPLWTDVSAYFDSPGYGVTYSMDHVPLRGRVRHPQAAQGAGPFPLVLVVHGNKTSTVPSHEGFDYLLDLLASHGMIAVSVDETFLNGSGGEMDARAIVLLRHLQRWRIWNTTPGHPFQGKVDLGRIGLAGHSRGGEAVTAAWLFNSTLHNAADPAHNFGFDLRALFAISPVDGQLGPPYAGLPITLSGVDYYVMHGSHDGDVYDFAGQQTYDRAHPVNAVPTGDKGLLFVHGANHNSWNTVWAPTPEIAVQPMARRLAPEPQQAIAKVFVSAFFQQSLLGNGVYKALLTDDVTFPSLPAGVTRVQQYEDRTRLFLNHFEEDGNLATGSVAGVTNTNHDGWLSPYVQSDFSDRLQGYRLWQQTHGLIAGWTSPQARFDVNVPLSVANQICNYPYLAVRVGQVYEAAPALNTPEQSQDLSLRLQLGTQLTPALHASSFDALPYPEPANHPMKGDVTKTILKTVRIPLSRFLAENPNLDLQALSQIQLMFDRQPSGLLAIDDLQLTQ